MYRSTIRSENGCEFTSKAVGERLINVGVQTLFIEPGTPWENGYCELFNGKFRDELLDREICYTVRDQTVDRTLATILQSRASALSNMYMVYLEPRIGPYRPAV